MNDPATGSEPKDTNGRSTSPSTFSNTRSSRSIQYSGIRSIITSPPWANDEPPSPTEEEPLARSANSIQPRPSQSALSTRATSITSSHSNSTAQPFDRTDQPLWWAFTRRGRLEGPPPRLTPLKHNWPTLKPRSGTHNSNGDAAMSGGVSNEKDGLPMTREKERAGSGGEVLSGVSRPDIKERLKSAWLPSSPRIRYPKASQSSEKNDAEGEGAGAGGGGRISDESQRTGRRQSWGFHIPLPTPATPITMAQASTPGWDTPWSPKIVPGHNTFGRSMASRDSGSGMLHGTGLGQGSNLGLRNGATFASADALEEAGAGRKRTKWYYRRKTLRSFVLSNNYVPLLFRVINITLTTAALAVAISIRRKERQYGIMGAVGSSPTLVIIFAPLLLVHVMVAIYLEYFGRPLGLWRTSSKLFHTLSETLFICAWASALSLCFDNFFTSVLSCAPLSDSNWYNELPRIVPNIDNLSRAEGEPGDYICHSQVALICLVFLGLVTYCMNLFISLFRIFEKVKYQPVQTLR